MPARYTVEIGLGIGVLGKGLEKAPSSSSASTSHETVWNSITESVSGLQRDRALHSDHVEKFFWTSSKPGLKSSRALTASAADGVTASPGAARFDLTSSRFEEALSLSCDFASAEVTHLQSHVSVSMDTTNHNPECMLLLSSVASLHPQVSHITAFSSELNLETQEVTSPTADDVFANTTQVATDQNAWTQTGAALATPYSDMGLDGSNHVLGMIDTGVDDFSCFFVDDSGTPTTRTPGVDYATPITEPERRKVIQYVAWADGLPASNYDHGKGE